MCKARNLVIDLMRRIIWETRSNAKEKIRNETGLLASDGVLGEREVIGVFWCSAHEHLPLIIEPLVARVRSKVTVKI